MVTLGPVPVGPDAPEKLPLVEVNEGIGIVLTPVPDELGGVPEKLPLVAVKDAELEGTEPVTPPASEEEGEPVDRDGEIVPARGRPVLL
jgi:hypothetical protein